jgi:D-alanine transaminase
VVEPLADLNGEQMPLAEARIPALDRGFLLGDAVYEVIRVYQGRPWLLDEHLRRLAHSLDAIRIQGVDLARLEARIRRTIAAGPFDEATVYIQITRGVAGRTHAFPAAGTVPLEFLYVKEFQDTHEELRRQGARVITHPDLRWARCDIKSTNLLANVLASQAAREAGCLEALLYLPDGTLTEGTHTSYFAVLESGVLTAPVSTDILSGITRSLILRLTRSAGIPVREEVLKRQHLGQLSELFLTGTTTEVMPVIEADGKPIGDGRPGPVTRRLQEAYREAVRAFIQG